MKGGQTYSGEDEVTDLVKEHLQTQRKKKKKKTERRGGE